MSGSRGVADLVFTFDVPPRTPGKHLARGLRMVAGGTAANATRRPLG